MNASTGNSQLNSLATSFGSGKDVLRVEDDALLQGAGKFTDDMSMRGQLVLMFLRSPYPHANIKHLDLTRAKSIPGVVALYTGQDLITAGVKHIPGGVGFSRGDGTPAATAPRYPLALNTVRFVGEAVACVVATSTQTAKDALEAIDLEFQELPHAVTIADATAENATPLWHAAPDNVCAQMRHGDATATAEAFRKAAHVVSLNIHHQRLAALSIEPRSVLAWVSDDDRLNVHMSTQMPSGVKNSLCNDVLGLPPEKVRVTVNDVGGGFGMKTGIYPEDVAVAWCALQLKQPVKWIADRSEEFLSSAHGRDLETSAQMALNKDGKILALKLNSSGNIGAYGITTSIAITLMIGPWVQTSVYDIQTIDFNFKAVMTNTAPTSAYRGAGRPEAIYTMERLMDEAARQIGIDRIELRRRNFIKPAQMPYKNPMNQVYDCGQFEYIMDKALAFADWPGFDDRAKKSLSRGKLRGLGIATFLEWTGGNAFEERVTVNVTGDGYIEVFAAVNAMGQGIATTLAQLVVDVFGLPIAKVKVILGDTDRGSGFGSAASRSIFTGGSAMSAGSEKTLTRAKQLAAKDLEASADDIIYDAGEFKVAGTDLGVSLFELASRQPGGSIFMEDTTKVAGPTWPNGCHVCEVEIDAATGDVQIVAYSSVNDIGRVINPMIARGQLDGGALQGIGQALHEKVVYDRQSGQLLTGSLMDYSAPRADAMACHFHNEMDQSVPTGNNPLGAKGVGELGTIGATPCVVNAVADALARTQNASHTALTPKLQMPLTAPFLWSLLNEKSK
jgi:aerobic carbon-monoxide dehydrogenase large subunit